MPWKTRYYPGIYYRGSPMRLAISLFAFLCSTVAVHADPRAVYRWEDPSSGAIHYSSKPPSKDAKPAKLPPIMRGESKIVKTKAITCD